MHDLPDQLPLVTCNVRVQEIQAEKPIHFFIQHSTEQQHVQTHFPANPSGFF